MYRTIKDIFLTFIHLDNIISFMQLQMSLFRNKKIENDELDLKRADEIKNFFILSKIEEKNSEVGKIIGPSELWRKKIEVNYFEIVKSCKENNLKNISLIMNNVFRTVIVDPMTYPVCYDLVNSKIHKNWYNKLRVTRSYSSIKTFSKKTKSNLIDELLLCLQSNAGNPIQLKVKKNYIAYEMVRFALYLIDLNKVLDLNKLDNKNIVDLGSGLGITLILLSKLNKNINFTCIDIPENLMIVSWLLQKINPEILINYNSYKNQKGCFNLIPYYHIQKIPKNKIDLVINTWSLPEMDKTSAVSYLDYMFDFLKKEGKFFSINRKESIKNTGYGYGLKYEMTGISELIKINSKFKIDKNVNLENSSSENNDFIYPDINIQIGLYSKRN